ncbi:hypothetical protein J7L48_04860 [bacterium]|nr:hypothetical protein [bacterium]
MKIRIMNLLLNGKRPKELLKMIDLISNKLYNFVNCKMLYYNGDICMEYELVPNKLNNEMKYKKRSLL